MIINGQRYEAEPAVEAYVKDLQAMLREESEENCELKAENFTLKVENARLEEGYQKSVGVIAATDCAKCKRDDSDVNHAISIIREFCRNHNKDCETCDAQKNGCMFVDYPDEWENLTALIEDGGAENE